MLPEKSYVECPAPGSSSNRTVVGGFVVTCGVKGTTEWWIGITNVVLGGGVGLVQNVEGKLTLEVVIGFVAVEVVDVCDAVDEKEVVVIGAGVVGGTVAMVGARVSAGNKVDKTPRADRVVVERPVTSSG